ncbi:MAG: riboflavin synthase [Actinobacteria bacterium]|nr:riboflavin synthase [Actinomycetota bacterium]
MFTGIVKEVGKIKNIIEGNKSKILEIKCREIMPGLNIGDSVAVNGCCLTARDIRPDSFIADLSEVTVSTTTFKFAKSGDAVNLEEALKASDRFGGHFVSGHIDGITEITGILRSGDDYMLKFRAPEELQIYIAAKGSVCIDGISLTIAQTKKNDFTVSIIPHTYEFTTLKFKKAGDSVNIEVDLLARYIFNILKLKDIGNIKKDQSLTEMEELNKRDEKFKEKLMKYGFCK